MLDRLERADLAAEGDAVQRVVSAHLQRAIGAADLFEGHQHRGAIEHAGQDAPAFVRRAERLGLAILERQFGLIARRVEIGERLRLDAAGLEIDQIQRDVGFAAARPNARGDDGEVGDGAVRHRLLDAVEHAIGGDNLDRLR